jgi:two-component system nitrate/nitrite response regulator NarL
MSENSRCISTMLVSRPGIMQQSLRSALAACREIAVVATAGDGLTALQQVTLHHPELLVIDSNLLDEEAESLITAVKNEYPNTCYLVFIRSRQQEMPLRSLGADIVTLRDLSAQQLQTLVARLAQTARDQQP